MGTTVDAWFDGSTRTTELETWFEEVESRCSRFQPDSELSEINGDTAPARRVSEMMWALLTEADRARALSGGLVDVGIGLAVSGWGYDRTFDEVTGLADAPDTFDSPRWSLNPAVRALVRSPGTGIDLGGIAKGWTCDRAVEMGLASVVSAGGDLCSADEATTATILDPGGGVVARVHIGSGALATSSVGRRRWQVGGRDVSHIIDPRTMTPVESPILSASVVARSAVDAEIGAKAVVLHGAEGLSWADSRDWIRSAVVVWHDGSVFATVGTEVAV